MNGVQIPLRDGKWLAGDISLPRGSDRFPAILIMTPYSRKNIGAALPDKALEVELPDQSNYAVVIVDWRGFFGSKAAKGLLPVGLPQHGKDGYDVIEWIAKQPWSNGKVGMWGPSGRAHPVFGG